jgi:hypothetical protein
MRVDRKLAEAAELDHADEPDRIQARHQAGGAMGEQRVVAPAHLVELAGEIEGEHGHLAGPVGLCLDHAHHRADALVEGAIRAVRLELVILDEIDAGLAELLHDCGRRFGIEAHARLDDSADQWPPLHARELTCAVDTEERAGVGLGEGRRHPNVEQPQSTDRPQLEEIAGDRREKIRQGRTQCRQRP